MSQTRPDPTPADDRAALSVLSTIDPVLRESAVFGLVVGAPGAVVVRHDIRATEGELHRVVVDAAGVVEDEVVPLEHACLSCAVREDAVPTLRRLADDGRWDHVVLALPVAAESLPVTRALAGAAAPGGELERLRLATVLAVVDVETVEHDLLADDLVAERGIALTDDDERAVGEVVAAQLEHADLVVTSGSRATAPTGSGLVDRLRGEDSHRLDGLHRVVVGDLAARSHDAAAAERRAHPLGAPHTGSTAVTRGRSGPPRRAASAGRAGHGVRAAHTARDPRDRSWTLELRSARPFDPERLLRRIEDLGGGYVRSRGVFHVANRPDSLCAWEGAGGQLSIGGLGAWADVASSDGASLAPHTRIVVVGARPERPGRGEDARPRLLDAFTDALATQDELSDGGLRWLGRDDDLAPWLGARSDLS
ncbi:GTP-binding protein [Cellulosimicrobium arenosum]|uniref:GTP-binding protein n=1 Tax=Cellulosimicrobium arenosum TaxID=2708133 RepID=A0A927J0F6_9MICO|nr:GTP-binding protein [Cellulosimicrobium arenosum]MBD8079619.1 GTP-binding protein [Cellulosimicrobium arenosum]